MARYRRPKNTRKSEHQLQIEEEYWRTREQLKRNIRRWEQKGYEVDIDVPDVPKRITEGSIRRLQRLKAKVRKTKKKYTAGELVYNMIIKMLGRSNNIPQAVSYIKRELRKAEDAIGKEQLMKNLDSTKPEVVEEADRILLDSKALQSEIKTGYWKTMINMGEEMFESDAREIGDIEADEEEQVDIFTEIPEAKDPWSEYNEEDWF